MVSSSTPANYIHLFTLLIALTLLLPTLAEAAILEVRITGAPDKVVAGEEFTIEGIIVNRWDRQVEAKIMLFAMTTKPFHVLDFRIGSESVNKTVVLDPGDTVSVTTRIMFTEAGTYDILLIAIVKDPLQNMVDLTRIIVVEHTVTPSTTNTTTAEEPTEPIDESSMDSPIGNTTMAAREAIEEAPGNITIIGINENVQAGKPETGTPGVELLEPQAILQEGQEPPEPQAQGQGEGAPWLGGVISVLLLAALVALGVLLRVPQTRLVIMIMVPISMIAFTNLVEYMEVATPTIFVVVGYIAFVGLLPPVLLYIYGRGVIDARHKVLGGFAVAPAIIESSYSPYLGWDSILGSLDDALLYTVFALAIVVGASSRGVEGKVILAVGMAMWQVFTTLLFLMAVLWPV